MAKKRRKHRRRRVRLDIRKILFFLLSCCVIVFAIALLLSKVISHKNEYYDDGLDLYNQGNYEAALDKFGAALEEKQLFSQNKDKNTILYIADIYMKTGRYDMALEEYKKLEDYSVNQKNIKEMQDMAQGLYDFSQGNYAGSLPVLEQYTDDYPELYMYIGTCYSEMDDVDNMFASYEKYIDKFGYNSYIYAQYAAYYISIGELDNAYGYINNGLASDDTFNPELRLQEITYYEKIYDYQKAYDLACELVEIYPDFQKGVDEYTFLYTRVSHDDE
jgi:tetratricopeptide (TPR) repeat protein